MKKIKTALIALSCLFLVGGGLTACNPEDPTPIVTISNGETATLEVGQTLQLNVTLEHSNEDIIYTSSNTAVATVNDTGLVTAVAKGEATITAKVGDISDTIKITVTEPAVTVVDVESVTLNKTEITLEIGGTETLTAAVLPENATDKTVAWETSNAEVATVANGVVTAVAKGEATITAKAGDKTATCKVSVNETVVEVPSITITNGETATMNTGDTLQLNATVENLEGTVAWTSSDDEVATVSGTGLVTALADGEVTITAAVGEIKDTIVITITTPAPEYLTIDQVKATAKDGDWVTVKGEVVATLGNSAYIADNTNGLYIYNFMDLKPDWVIGTEYMIHGQIDVYNGLFQVTGYNTSGGTISIEEVKEDTITPMTPIELDETSYSALDSMDSGKLYTFEAEYVSGTPKKGSAVSTNWKLGDTNVVLRTDKYDENDITTDLIPGAVYKVTTPLSWYNGAQFAFIGDGTKLEKQKINVESLSISASKTEAIVGETVALTATKTPANADGEAIFAITSDENSIGTLNGNELTASGAGTVKVQASIGEVKSSELSITFTTPSEHGTASYDMSKGWDTAKFSNSNIVAAFGAEAVAYATPGDIAETFSSISVLNGQNIVKTLSISGRIAVPVDNSNMSGLIIGASDTIQNIPSQATNGTPILNFVFDKPVEKMTLKIIPCATSTKIDFTINDEQHLQESITSTGGIESVVTIEHTFAESTTECVLKNAWGKGTQFAIVGISFTY